MSYKKLLGESNAKTVKGEKLNYLTGIVYLAPSNMVEGINTCSFASKGCRSACLFTAGRGVFSNVKQARINKTILFRDNINYFMYSLVKDITRLVNKAKKKNMIPVIRLNGTSDISFENIRFKKGKNIFEIFPNVQFYDYTKDYTRVEALTGKWNNYQVTFSLSESNMNQAKRLSTLGVNVAIVFRNDIPLKWNNIEVVNGDNTDLRFLDGKNKIVALKAKGKAKNDLSGFVQDYTPTITPDNYNELSDIVKDYFDGNLIDLNNMSA